MVLGSGLGTIISKTRTRSVVGAGDAGDATASPSKQNWGKIG